MALSDRFVPYVHIDPPRYTYVMWVHLRVGANAFRAYHTYTDNPAEWLAKWEEDWEEMAADLWDYTPYLPVAEAPARGGLLKTLGLRKPIEPIRRRI